MDEVYVYGIFVGGFGMLCYLLGYYKGQVDLAKEQSK